MTGEEQFDFIIEALKSASRSDDIGRAKAAFRGLTPEQMQQQHGQSGRTRQAILDGYLTEEAKVQECIRFVEQVRRIYRNLAPEHQESQS